MRTVNKNKLILNSDEILKVIGKKYKGLSNIFSDKFGIVNAILERHELDKYNLYMYQCLSANTKILFDISRDVSSGGLGVSEEKNVAMTSCLAEALERYCMSYIPKNEIISCKKDELDEKHIFSNFFTYNDEQYTNFDNFLNPNLDVIEWTKIYSIKDKKKYM